MDGDERVISFTPPEENRVTMSEGGERSLLKVFHEYIREGGGGGFSHPQASRLGVEFSTILEISQLDVEFEKLDDVFRFDGGSLLKQRHQGEHHDKSP